MNCPHCAKIKGDWSHCPLCQSSLIQESQKKRINKRTLFSRYSLHYNQQYSILFISLVIVSLYLLVQYFWTFEFFGLEYVILDSWLHGLILFFNKKNHMAQSNYVLFRSLVSVYID